MTAAPEVSPEPIMQMMSAMQASAILRAGVNVGVFGAIAGGATTPGAVASAVGADERGTRILLDALVALGLLTGGAGEPYGLPPMTETFLVPGKPMYVGESVNILAGDIMWQGFPQLPDAVRRGGTLMDSPAETPCHAWWETFAASSAALAAPAAHHLAGLMSGFVAGRDEVQVLDVACGSGFYGLTLAGAHPQVRPTLLDWPNVLEVTKGNVEKLGLADRTSYLPGDIFEVALGGPYDLIVASHIFHHFSEERCQALMTRLAQALKPDGRLVVHDFVTGGPPAEAPFPYMFSIVMLIWTSEGEAYSLADYTRLLEKAGLSAPEVHPSPGMPATLLISQKA